MVPWCEVGVSAQPLFHSVAATDGPSWHPSKCQSQLSRAAKSQPGPGANFSRAPSLMNLINLIKSLNANQRRIRGGGGGGGGLGVATPPFI